MMIKRCDVAEKLTDYLHHRIALKALINWAEDAMREEEFEEEQFDVLRDIISRLGVADVEAFGLTWDTIEDYLERLGYQVQVEVSQAR